MAVEPNFNQVLRHARNDIFNELTSKGSFKLNTYLDSFNCILNLIDSTLRGECVYTTIVVFLAIDMSYKFLFLGIYF